jgi:hypothetical protein
MSGNCIADAGRARMSPEPRHWEWPEDRWKWRGWEHRFALRAAGGASARRQGCRST